MFHSEIEFGMILYVTHSFHVKRISEIIIIFSDGGLDYPSYSNDKITAKIQRAHFLWKKKCCKSEVSNTMKR